MMSTGKERICTGPAGFYTASVENAVDGKNEAAENGFTTMQKPDGRRRIRKDPTGALAHSNRVRTAPLATTSREAPPPIMAHPEPPPTPPVQTIERMSRQDACPDCVINVETPYVVHDTAPGFVASYGCHACGHIWQTSWSES